MDSALGLVADHLIQTGLGLAALATALFKWLRGRDASAERSHPFLWAAAHWDREYQHSKTVLDLLRAQEKLKRAELNLDSLNEELAGQDQRIDQLLETCFDGSSRASLDQERRRRSGQTPPRRRPAPTSRKTASASTTSSDG